MIIYGSNIYGKKDVVKGWGCCENCGVYGEHISYNGRKWGHLYFIPLLPMGSRVRALKECEECSYGTTIPEKNVPAMLNDVRRNSASALAALIGGQKEFDFDGTMTPCVTHIAEAIELLYCLCAEEDVRSILATLQEKDQTYAYHLVNGVLLEFRNNLQEASESYSQAAECEPNDASPLIALGYIHLKSDAPEEARPFFEKALELTQDRLPVLQALLVIYDSISDYDKLSETYEECFNLVPESVKEKKFVKAYKKACKKAGKEIDKQLLAK